jgi:serine/threonine protein phosphatase PrpC
MQLTEDHTLLARLLAAGIDVDTTMEGSRFKSMLTNALGIGTECKVSTFVVPLADGDRFLLCSDGISEYVKEAEVGEVLTKQPSPARAAQKLVELALDRGGADNATALVVRVLEAGETPHPAEQRKRDDEAIAACPFWGLKVSPQQRLRALRIAIHRDHAAGDKIPAQTLGDRVAWILIEGEVEQAGARLGASSLLYPEALVADAQLPDKDSLAVATADTRALAIRADDFRELCEDDTELGEALGEQINALMAARRAQRQTTRAIGRDNVDWRATTDPDGRGAAQAAAQAANIAIARANTQPRQKGQEQTDLERAATQQLAVPRADTLEDAAIPQTVSAETSEPAIINAPKPPEEQVAKKRPITPESGATASGSIEVGKPLRKRDT